MMQAELPTAPEVQRALDEVYALPELRTRELSWLQERWQAVREWFFDLVDRINLLETTSPVLFWIIVGWLVLSALAILGHFALTAHQAFRVRERRGRAARGDDAAPGLPRGAAEWEAEARRAAAEGRLRDAALALYQALLLRLEAGGAVRYDPSKTPGDYRREARAKPEAARVLDEFLRGFEPVAFGGRPMDGARYDALRRVAGRGGALG